MKKRRANKIEIELRPRWVNRSKERDLYECKAYTWKTTGVLSRKQKIRGETVDCTGGGGKNGGLQKENA